MGIIFYLVRTVVIFVLYFLEVIMLVRAVMSFVAPTAGGQIAEFAYTVSELVISPVRALLDRFEFVRRSPIDLSFTATWLIIAILLAILN